MTGPYPNLGMISEFRHRNPLLLKREGGPAGPPSQSWCYHDAAQPGYCATRNRAAQACRSWGRPAATVVLARDCGLSLGRQHAHSPAAAPPAELDLAVHQGEQGVIPAAADSDSGVEVSAVLTHDDLASAHELTAEPLHAEPLGVGVPPVPAGRRALLVCHLGSAHLPRTGAGLRGTGLGATGLGGTDTGNADLGVLLPVAQAAAV